MDEVILSRIRQEAYEQGYQDGKVEGYNLAAKAEPQQKKGKWRTGKYDTAGNMKVMTVECSSCGKEATSLISTDGLLWNIEMVYDFCPNCGAEMSEGETDA